MRSTRHEFISFLFWGAINSLAGYLIYAGLVLFLPYLAAYTIAYAAGILFSYLLNSKFVFKQKLQLKKALAYPIVYVVQFFLGAAMLWVLVQLFHVHKLVAPMIMAVVLVPITFLLSRTILKGRSPAA